MVKALIRNSHNGPLDVATLDGTKRVAAMGALTADFDKAYLDQLQAAGIVSVEVAPPEKPKEKPAEAKAKPTEKKGR